MEKALRVESRGGVVRSFEKKKNPFFSLTHRDVTIKILQSK